ncbi:MAG: hypothetical protein ACM358_14095 [Gemmatimonadota bacterium]
MKIVKFVAVILACVAIMHGCFALFAAHCAHAGTDPEGWRPVAADPLGLEGRIMAWSVAIYATARTVLELLKVIAPRTSTHVDDEVRDALARILADARPADPPRQPPSSIAGMIGVLTIGAALAVQPACATAERAGGAGKIAALKCGEPQLATAASLIARWAVQDALAGTVDWAAHETDALGFGLGVGTCAYAEVRRAWKARPVVQALAVGPVPDDGSAGLERLRARLGGVQIVLADGAVQ